MSEPSVWVPFLVLGIVILGLVVRLARLQGQVTELSQRVEEVDKRASAAQPVADRSRAFDAPSDSAERPSATVSTRVSAAESAPKLPAQRPADPLPATGFTDQVLAESVIKGAGLLHGLRRASTPQGRNRIAFSMRQEIKRARKQRRTEIKAARRHLADLERADMSRSEDAA